MKKDTENKKIWPKLILGLFIIGVYLFFQGPSPQPKKPVIQSRIKPLKKVSSPVNQVVKKVGDSKKNEDDSQSTHEQILVQGTTDVSLIEAIDKIIWERSLEDCNQTRYAHFRNEDYDFTCESELKKIKDLEITNKQSYVKNKFLMYRSYINGINEPVNINNEQKNIKMIQFLLNDYAFMSLILDKDFMVTKLEYDQESYKAALKYKGFHKEINFNSRFKYMLETVRRTFKAVERQCTRMSNPNACRATREFRSFDLLDTAKHHLYEHNWEKLDN